MWTASACRQYGRRGDRYATDLTDVECALIEPFLPPPKSDGGLRTTSLREMVSAILDVLRAGCQWRLLPTSFPPGSTVFGYRRQFRQLGIWTRLGAALLTDGREQAGRQASTSAAIIDRQSVKTTELADSRTSTRPRRSLRGLLARSQPASGQGFRAADRDCHGGFPLQAQKC
jgi:transposase